MTDEELREAIARGRELAGVEFKAGGPRDEKILRAKVIRAAIAMANRRDGGYVVIGVAERDGSLVPTGVSPADLETWSYDQIADSIAPYVSPHVEFDVSNPKAEAKVFVAIRVHEFSDTPVLCKKPLDVEGKQYLREGACYVRPRHKAESSEVGTYADMRDLMDLAAEKAVRRVLRTVQQAAGVRVDMPSSPDDELYDSELGDLK